jgi:hypothetical protein
MATLMNRFVQSIILAGLRFYAKKAIFVLDDTIKKYSQFSKFIVTCDECQQQNSYLHQKLLTITDTCIACR